MFRVSLAHLGLAAALLLASSAASTAVVAFFLVRIAPDHFLSKMSPTERRPTRPRSLAARVVAVAARNLLGLALLCAGAVMAIPGVPGPGVLTMLVGLLLLDLPGKRRLELALLRRPPVLAAINRIRARFSRPPLLVEEPAGRDGAG